MKRILFPLLLLLAACGSAPVVPDFTYFRLPPAAPLPAGTVFDAPVVVEPFTADGLYADQALVYALDEDAQQLRQYHYQLWTDPPTRILQRRLIAQLRSAGAAALVTDEFPASRPAVRISGIILRLDRVPAGAGWRAAVALKLRADAPDGAPLVDEYYREDVAAGDGSLAATVTAFGTALDRVFVAFHADLRKAGVAHAR